MLHYLVMLHNLCYITISSTKWSSWIVEIVYQSLAKTNEMKVLLSRLLASMYPAQVNRVTLTQVTDLLDKLWILHNSTVMQATLILIADHINIYFTSIVFSFSIQIKHNLKISSYIRLNSSSITWWWHINRKVPFCIERWNKTVSWHHHSCQSCFCWCIYFWVAQIDFFMSFRGNSMQASKVLRVRQTES